MQLKIHVMFARQQLAVKISNNIECCLLSKYELITGPNT